MSKKYTLEQVDEIFKKENCKLISTEYKDNKSLLSYICSCGIEAKVSLKSFLLGTRCSECRKNKLRSKFQLEYTEVKKIFEDNGCILLETQYFNCDTPMRYICSCGRESKIRLYCLQKGHRCKECGKVKNFKSIRKNYDEVKKIFEDNGCVLLDQIYINYKTPLKYICSCGRESKIRLGEFKRSKKCKYCGIKKRSGENNCNWNPDREFVKQNANIGLRSRNLIKHILKKINSQEIKNSKELLGYSRRDIYNHITNHPNWEMVKNEKWHIDHIFPVNAFISHGITDLKIINALDNLQPISAKENLSKGGKYCEEDFLKYIQGRQNEF